MSDVTQIATFAAAGIEAEMRDGERQFSRDPAAADDARLCFIGRIASPWRQRSDCPKNMRQARERGGPAVIEIDTAFRGGLADLEAGMGIHILTWLDRARRDLSLQAPRHSTKVSGTFSLRSPVRPNPIGMHLAMLVAIDIAAGRLTVDAIDVLDGTPVLDIKPYFETVDRLPGMAPADIR